MKAMDDSGWEAHVHGRGRNKDSVVDVDSCQEADELRFGVLHEPMYLARGKLLSRPTEHEKSAPPQWTGVVSSIAESMLEQGLVDGVVCIGTSQQSDDPLAWATPEPLLARTVADVRRGRGVGCAV